MNSQADSQKFKKMVLNSVQEKQVLKNHPRGVFFVRSEQGPFFVWAQPDCWYMYLVCTMLTATLDDDAAAAARAATTHAPTARTRTALC